MNPLTTMKNTAQALVIAVTLISGLLLIPATAMADNDGIKRHYRGSEYSSQKNNRNSHYKKSHRNEVKHNGHKRVMQKNKRGKLGHMIENSHRYYDRGYRHKHAHADNHVRVINEYRLYDHGHSHHYDYDPRITVGLHIGHFDLYFED